MSETGGGYPPGGRPFDRDYPDPEPGEDEVRDVRGQVAALDSLSNPEVIQAQVEAMAARRSGRSVSPSTVRFALLPASTLGGAHPVLVVTNEVLLRIDRIPGLFRRFVLLVLALLGWLRWVNFLVVREESALSSIVVRLRSSRPGDAGQALRLVAVLRRLGLDAGVSYCVTTSPVQKPRFPTPSSPTPRRLPAPARPIAPVPGPPPETPEPPAEEPATTQEQAARVADVSRVGARPIVVAVIDTGLTAQRRSDGELQGVQGRGGADPLDAFPLGMPDGFLDLAAGHGTFVAGIIARIVRPVADLVEVRVYRAADSDGVASEFDLATAMIRAVDDGAHLLNVSCGARTLDDRPAIALGAALEIIDGRATVVAASGNLGGRAKMWPAGFADTDDSVISVASLKESPAADFPQGSAWACHGDWVKASAVGEGVRSVYVEGRTEDPGSVDFGPDAHARWSGTSFAAPQVAGGIARIAAGLLATWPPADAVALAARELLAAGVPLDDYGQALHILPGVPV